MDGDEEDEALLIDGMWTVVDAAVEACGHWQSKGDLEGADQVSVFVRDAEGVLCVVDVRSYTHVTFSASSSKLVESTT